MQLKNNKRVEGEIKVATILYAKLKGYSEYFQGSQEKITKFLYEVHERIEEICQKNEVFKVHSYLDSFLIMGYKGKSESRNHYSEAVCIGRTAIEILEEITKLRERDGMEVQIQIGVHSGDIMGGMVGSQQAPYDIMGGNVRLLYRLMKHISPGVVLITERTMFLMQDSLDMLCDVGFKEYKSFLDNDNLEHRYLTYILYKLEDDF